MRKTSATHESTTRSIDNRKEVLPIKNLPLPKEQFTSRKDSKK